MRQTLAAESMGAPRRTHWTHVRPLIFLRKKFVYKNVVCDLDLRKSDLEWSYQMSFHTDNNSTK